MGVAAAARTIQTTRSERTTQSHFDAMKASSSDDSRANPLCHVWMEGVAGECGGAGRWAEDAGPAAFWGELRLTFCWRCRNRGDVSRKSLRDAC